MSTVAIRPYADPDMEALRVCVVELQDSGREFDERLRPGEAMADAYIEEMHERCRKYAGVILVAERGGTIDGFVMVLAQVPFESLDDPPGEYALVAELIVRSDSRGQGLGRRLMRAAEEFARIRGATELRVWVLARNKPATLLYRSEGFEPYTELLAKRLHPPR